MPSANESTSSGPLIAPRNDPARPAPASGSGGPRSVDPSRALVGWIGLLLLMVSGADVLVTWLPLELGNPEWEFGTVSASFNGLLSVTLGLALILFGLRGSGRSGLLRATSALLVLLAIFVLGAAALYGLSVPLALGSMPEGPVGQSLQKAVAKTLLQSLAFPVAYLAMARAAWKWSA